MLRRITVGASLSLCLLLQPALPAGAAPSRQVPPEVPDATGACVSAAAKVKDGRPSDPGTLGSFPFLDDCDRPVGLR